MNYEQKYLKYLKKYTELFTQQIGGTPLEDADTVCRLLFTKVSIDKTITDDDYSVFSVNSLWKPYLNKVEKGCFPTERLERCINILNSSGESIIYNAFGFGTNKALNYILKTKGLNINLLNSAGRTAIIGAALELDNYLQINSRITDFLLLGGDITLVKEININDFNFKEDVFLILNFRINQPQSNALFLHTPNPYKPLVINIPQDNQNIGIYSYTLGNVSRHMPLPLENSELMLKH